MAFGLSAGSILGIGASLLGGAMGSKGSSTTSSSAPWVGQQPYLTAGFSGMQGALNKALGQGTFSGQRVADLNPYSIAGANATGNYSLGTGLNNSLFQTNTGMGAMGNLGSYGNNASNLLANYMNGDPTQYALNMANTYANSPYADNMVDAASRDISRNLNENQLTGLNLAATGSGNMNSSRAGVAEGIMRRGAADRVGDISANLRGNLFNTGLSNGLNQYNTNFTNSLAGNNQLYNAAGLGNTMFNQGNASIYNNLDAAIKAGQMFQNQDQNQLTSNMNAFNEARDTPMNLWQKYMTGIGGSYGSNTTSNSGGGVGGALGGAMSGLGLYNQFAKLTSNPAQNSGGGGFIP